ncbi:MAG: STAS domain-containing protein [Planctomycetota bacterium]
MTQKPPLESVLEAARVARERGDLATSRRALEHAYERLGKEPALRGRAALEAEALGKELAIRGAPLAALGEWMRSGQLGRDQARNLRKLVEHYPRWRPAPGPIGVAKDALTAGASGAFWVGLEQRGRILTLAGGITGSGTDGFRRVLTLASSGVEWLLLDVAQLTYVGSAGLAVVVKTAERLRTEGGAVALFSLSTNLKLLVETLGLANSLNPVEDLEQALSLALRRNGG